MNTFFPKKLFGEKLNVVVNGVETAIDRITLIINILK